MAVATSAAIGTGLAAAGAGAGVGTAVAAGAVAGGLSLASQRKQKKEAEAARRERERTIERSGALEPLEAQEVAEPDFQTPEELLASYIRGLTQQFPQAEALADQVNAASLENRDRAFNQVNPRFNESLGTLTDNVLSFASGRLPGDVVRNITDTANEDAFLRGFSTGQSGNGGNVFAGGNDAAANLALENLGLTSLDLSQRGTAQIPTVLAETRTTAGPIRTGADFFPDISLFQNQGNLVASSDLAFQQALFDREAAVSNATRRADFNRLLLDLNADNNANRVSNANAAATAQAVNSTAGAVLKGIELSGLGASTTRTT